MLATSLMGSASAALASAGPATKPAPKRPIVTTLSPQVNGPIAALYFLGDRARGFVRVLTGVGVGKGPDHGTVYHTDGINDGPDGFGVIKDSRLPSGPSPTP